MLDDTAAFRVVLALAFFTWLEMTQEELLQQRRDFGQRFVELGRVAAAGLREIGTSAAGAADDWRDILDDVARFDLAREIGRHRNQQRHFALAKVGAERDHCRAVLLAQSIRYLAHRARIDAVEFAGHDLYAGNFAHLFFRRVRARAAGELLFHRAELFLQLLLAREQLLEPLDRRAIASAELRADFLEDFLALANCLE